MNATSYARLAGAVFAVVALLQLARALAGWSVAFEGTAIPVWASWIACVVAGALAWLGVTVGSPALIAACSCRLVRQAQSGAIPLSVSSLVAVPFFDRC